MEMTLLRSEVGGLLPDRGSNRVGQRFYERVGPHLAGIEEAAIEASGSAGIVRGRLRVNVDPFFSRIVLSSHIREFLVQHHSASLADSRSTYIT